MSRRRNKSRAQQRPSKRAQQALAEQRAKIAASYRPPRRIVDDGPSLANLSEAELDFIFGDGSGRPLGIFGPGASQPTVIGVDLASEPDMTVIALRRGDTYRVLTPEEHAEYHRSGRVP